MTPTELEAFKAEAAARGLSHVITPAGAAPLAEWSPYGCFSRGGDRELGALLPCPSWVNDYQARDFDRSNLPEGVSGCMWTFLRPDAAERMNEHDHNRGRKRQ